jgi:hypothetical protein
MDSMSGEVIWVGREAELIYCERNCGDGRRASNGGLPSSRGFSSGL